MNISVTTDLVVQSTLQAIKNKIREQHRIKLKDIFEMEESAFKEVPKEKLRDMIIEIENEIFR